VKRVAAVDYGRRRIGLAISDPLGITVRGLPTVVRDDDLEAAAAAVGAALREAEADEVVVGLPVHTDGRESAMSAETRRFAALLAAALPIPQHFSDEGDTTWEAEEAVKARGIPLRTAKQSGLLDQEAACGLLRAWLREPRK
jgi:putative Holliday junction resolvase